MSQRLIERRDSDFTGRTVVAHHIIHLVLNRDSSRRPGTGVWGSRCIANAKRETSSKTKLNVITFFCLLPRNIECLNINPIDKLLVTSTPLIL